MFSRICKKTFVQTIIKILIVLAITLPICVTCLYIMPVDDDFSNAFDFRLLLNKNNSYIVSAVIFAISLYRSTSGYFFAAFLNYFFSPLVRWGIVGIRIFCFSVNLLLFVTLYFFTRAVMKKILKVSDHNAIYIIYVLLLLCFTNVWLNKESMFWYCVVVAYVLVIVCMLWGLIAYITAIDSGRWRYLVPAAVLGFLSSGGSLNVTALNCCLYLCLAVYGWVINRKKIAVTGFGMAFLGALVNVASPGNYLRHEDYASNYNFTAAFVDSGKYVLKRMCTLFSSSVLPFLLIGVFLCVLFFAVKVRTSKYIHPIVLAAAIIFSLTVINFPVYLGYQGIDYFPDRCVFVNDTALYFFLFAWIIYSASWLKTRFKIQLSAQHVFLVLLILFVPFCTRHDGEEPHKVWDSYPSIYLTTRILNGSDAQFADYWSGVLSEVEHSADGAVVVKRDKLKLDVALKAPKLSSDSEDWVNQYVAWYFGKDSLTFSYNKKEKTK